MKNFNGDDDRESKEKKTRRDARNAGETLRDKMNDSVGSGTGGRGWATKQQLKKQLGICHDCTNLEYTRSEFGKVWATCTRDYERPIRLSGNERIVECTVYYAKHQLSLSEMSQIATLIDPNPKRIKGFGK